jgi:hypothetical protein
MSLDLPPIVKNAERLLLEIEQAVRRFTRYHKYSHGARLREQAMRVAQLAHRAWRDRKHQAQWTDKLIWAVDDFKLSLQLGKNIEAFVSFAQFEMLAKLASDLGKQCGGWRKQQRSNGQNGAAKQLPFQSAEILSSHAASEARP